MDAPIRGEILAFEGFRFDPRARQVLRRDPAGVWVPVPIHSRALEILAVLLNNPGTVVCKDAIMTAVWPGVAVEPNNLTVHIAALRRLLDEGRSGESCIKTIPGRGYQLALHVTRAGEAQSGPVSAPIADPTTLPDAPARSRRPSRHWQAAAACAVVIVALLVAAAWHGGWFSPTPAPPRLSLVVLPFENLSGDASENYLVEGITDDLTTDLSNIWGMFVTTRESAYAYQGKTPDVRKIGGELRVRYALQGSVRKLGDELWVNARLVSTESGAQLWADRFDEQVKDLSGGQQEIVRRISQTVNVALTDIECVRSKRERPTNPDAFDLVLCARALAYQTYSVERLAAARALYERALELDRDSVDAKVGLADILLDSFTNIDIQPDDGTLNRAAQLVEDLTALHPDAHSVLHLRVFLLRDQERWPEAIATSQRLIELYPHEEFGYNNLAVCKLAIGAAAEAIPLLEQSIRLRPRSPALDNRYERMAFAMLLLGRDEQAIVWEQRALAANPEARARERSRRYLMLAAAFALAGHHEDAYRAIAEANRLWPYATVRSTGAPDPSSSVLAPQLGRIREGLRLAGLRDHAEEDADFHIASDGKLTDQFAGPTPTTVPGASTIRTTDLTEFLAKHQPIVIDTALYFWGRSIPGAIGLRGAGVGGSLSGSLQTRLSRMVQALTHGDRSLPVVAVGWNSERFDGRNLALRLVALGYTHVYWYRGGREAWEVAGLPETEVAAQDW